jgi:hypothetical protein
MKCTGTNAGGVYRIFFIEMQESNREFPANTGIWAENSCKYRKFPTNTGNGPENSCFFGLAPEKNPPGIFL